MMQPGFVRSFVPQAPLPAPLKRRAVFCGSGDSLAAAMLAEAFSGGLARAADPLEIVRDPAPYRGRRLYVVSVSGRTASNVRAAGAVPGSVAVTASGGSPLGRASPRSIPLRYPSSGTFTAGSIGFLASALTCISLVSDARIPAAAGAFGAARRGASGIRLSGNVFVLGDRATYPVAMYCAAKMHEVLGRVAQYERIEQFPHMGLFSARPGDTVLIFGGGTAHEGRLAGSLGGLGLNVVRPGAGGGAVRRVLHAIFFSQFLALGEARAAGIDDCHFVTDEAARGASSGMIY